MNEWVHYKLNTDVENREKLKEIRTVDVSFHGHLEKLKIIYFKSKNFITKPSLKKHVWFGFVIIS
jgi:hypothetical protein